MSDNRYYVKLPQKTQTAARYSTILALDASRDHLNRIPLGTLGIQQRRQALIQSGEPPFLMQRQSEQIAIRYLIMSHEPPSKLADGILEWQVVGPKTMCWLVNVKR